MNSPRSHYWRTYWRLNKVIVIALATALVLASTAFVVWPGSNTQLAVLALGTFSVGIAGTAWLGSFQFPKRGRNG